MPAPAICAFIKFFSEEGHADQFMAGSLYLNTLAYFKELESESDDGRMDSTEAVAMWWQPHDISIKLNIPGIGETEITSKDLAGPISMSFDFHEYWHIFCLYAVHMTGFEWVNGKIDCGPEDTENLQQQLKIDDRCLNLGKFAVIVVDVVGFLNRLQESLKVQGYKCRTGLVEYYDDEVFHGEIAMKDIPFRKQKRFDYQREFRLCANTETKQKSPLSINIGDVSDTCLKVESSFLPGAFAVKFEAAQ